MTHERDAHDSDGGGLILPWLDENLERLAKHENDIQVRSKLFINSDSHPKDEVHVLHECLDYTTLLFREYQTQDDDEVTVLQLGARIFNSGVCGLRLALSGYYQGAFFFARDLLETAFLLDFFHSEPVRISEWRLASNRDRVRNYGPAKIREALDSRDGFTTRKREERYRLLCEYAAHVTYPGLKLLAPTGNVTFGPFFDEYLLRRTLEELTAEVVQATLNWSTNLNNLPPHLFPEWQQFNQTFGHWTQMRKASTGSEDGPARSGTGNPGHRP